MKNKLYTLVLGSLLLGSGMVSAAVVTITDKYNPSVVHVKAGETITWRNLSDIVHTVTADPALAQRQANVKLPPGARAFHSGNISPQGSFSKRFDVRGTYRYFCVPHELEGMLGTIVVQ